MPITSLVDTMCLFTRWNVINNMLFIFMPLAIAFVVSFKRYFDWAVEHDKEYLFAKAINDDIDQNLENLRLKLENQSIKAAADDLIVKAERVEKQMQHKKLSVSNCPNCGAPVNGKRCDYCGTVFI